MPSTPLRPWTHPRRPGRFDHADTGFDQGIDQGLMVDVALDGDPIAYQTGHEAGIHDAPVVHVADRYDGEDLPIGAAHEIAVPVQRPAGVAFHDELQPLPQRIHKAMRAGTVA